MRVTGNCGLGSAGDKLARLAENADKKIRIMIFQGSARNKESCPDQWGKTRKLIQHAVKSLPDDVEFDFCDLSVKGDGNIIQPCKGCISTAGGFHCHFPCSCYSKGDEKLPDFMHNNDVYVRIKKAHGFIVYTPINWYAPSSVVKSLFDRLVCVNLTITKEQAVKMFGPNHIKDARRTRPVEKDGKHNDMLVNHLAGKTAAFFIHGDDGGADYKSYAKKPRAGTPSMPNTLLRYMKRDKDGYPSEGKANSPREAIMPIVWQCRYSGIDVPDDLVMGMHVNEGLPYAEGNDEFRKEDRLMNGSRDLLLSLTKYIRHKEEMR